MKAALSLLLILLSFNTFAQIAIGTISPQGMLHIDGQKDNPQTGQPSIEQQKNDVVITSDGKLGVGTTTPTAKLEVKGYIKVGTQEDELATVPSVGMIRFNTSTSTFEGYVANTGGGSPGWVALHN